MQLAPIILFVYNRPEHIRQTLNALAQNNLADQSTLYIYADGPKKDADAITLQAIKKTRGIIKSTKWCKEVFIIERDENYGLQKSVIEGVTEIVNKHGSVIVLEDDIITSKYFLQYMNDALTAYANEQKVISIGSLNFFATDKEVPDTFFIPIPDCWGWATWKNRWQLFEPNAQLLINKLREKGLIEKFNLNGAYNFENLLIDQIKGNVNSWAIRWQAVAYLEDKLTLYPRYSVTKNIGFGQGGTHGGDDKYSKHIKFAKEKVIVKKNPIVEDPAIVNRMIAGYSQTTQPGSLIKIKAAIRNALKYLAPAFLSRIYRKIKPHYQNNIMWQGNFLNWEEAKKKCTGYDMTSILEKTKTAVLKVKNGEAVFERDTVLFDKPTYNWPLLSILLKAAAENNGKLSVLDFGGSLGSTYFQNLPMIQSLQSLEWSIVEQDHYINIGNDLIADENLKFYFSIDECLKERNPDVLLLSNVLQYLEKPFDFIERVLPYKFNHIIFDRTAFTDSPDDRLTIQTVPASIYNATYPAWFFNSKNILTKILYQYQLMHQFNSEIEGSVKLDNQTTGYWCGYIFKLKTT